MKKKALLLTMFCCDSDHACFADREDLGRRLTPAN